MHRLFIFYVSEKRRILANRNAGVTFVELLIVLSIVVGIVAGGFALFGGMYQGSQLNDTTTQIIQTLRTARERAVAGMGDALVHGVYFESNNGMPDRFILYRGSIGTTYADRDIAFDHAVTMGNTLSLSASLDVSFNRGLGNPNTTGTFTLTHENGTARTIRVNAFGAIEEE